MDEAPESHDDELVARTQAGDPEAFDDLVVRYSPRLYGLIYNMTSNHEDTNDLLQEVFAKAYRSISGFRGNSTFYTWMHSIAVNMTINFMKKRGRRHTMVWTTWMRESTTIRTSSRPPLAAILDTTRIFRNFNKD